MPYSLHSVRLNITHRLSKDAVRRQQRQFCEDQAVEKRPVQSRHQTVSMDEFGLVCPTKKEENEPKISMGIEAHAHS